MSKPLFDVPDPADPLADTVAGDDVPVQARFSNGGAAPLKPALVARPQTLPMLSLTPPTVAKALVKAYPYLVIVNRLLAVATWTNDNQWINLTLVALFALTVLYFETLVVWLGHIILVAIVTVYATINNHIIDQGGVLPTLDEVVHQLTATCIKADMLLVPITSLSLTAYDIKRLMFTTVFLTPLYLALTFLLVRPRLLVLATGLYVLTYHLVYLRVLRRMLWRFKATRVLVFYLTGLDFSVAKNKLLFQAAMAKMNRNTFDPQGKPVRFTYVIYENQRKWLGIGWTLNLLTYERTPWTDEFLNELALIEDFKLPEADGDTPYTLGFAGATWRWVDKTWRLDLTNDGAIQLPAAKRLKTTANPGTDEGYVYSDNTWKKPAAEDTFLKYTRRRRWIRTAELVFNEAPEVEVVLAAVGTTALEDKLDPRKRKLRFAELDTVLVIDDNASS